MEDVKRFSFDVGWVLASSVVTLAIGFLLRIVLARWLGADDLGLYTMVITIQAVAVFVAGIGIPLALIKYVAEYKDRRDKLFEITSAAFIGSIILGLAVGILLYTLSGTIAGLFDMPELASLLKILAIALPFASIFETVLGLFNGLRQMKIYAYVMVIRNFLMTLFIVTFVWLGFGVEGAVWGIVISVVGGCLFGLYFSRKFLRIILRGLLQGIKRLVSFGSQVFGADALGLILLYTDIILIGYFLSAEDIGYYSIAISVSAFFLVVPTAIQRITYPATSEYWSQNKHQSLSIMIDKSMKYSACILLPFGLGVGFFSKELVTGVFGQEFIYAALPLIVLLIARVIRGSTLVPVGGSFAAIGRPDIPLKLSAIAAGANVGLNILLIPPFGILGAAIATTTSLLLGVIISLALFPKMLKVRVDIKWYAKSMGFAVIAIALFFAGRELINPYIVGSVILCGYTALVLGVFLSGEDRAILKSLAYSLVRRR